MTFLKKIPLFLPILLLFTNITFAQTDSTPPSEELLETKITRIIEEKQIQFEETDTIQLYQKLELLITKGLNKGETIIVEHGAYPMGNVEKYKKGDRLFVVFTENAAGEDLYLISDYIRRVPLLILFLIFVITALIIGKFWSVRAFLGLFISYLIIIKFILPQIIGGANPVLIAILGSAFIIPINFYLSHGFKPKTHLAIIGTLFSLLITIFLSKFFIEYANLTGYASDEASFLQIAKNDAFNMKGLLLAGIIIGVLGVLDDVTISQASTVSELKKADPEISFKKLYSQAMTVGKDHMSSMINTLALVYSGASLPLLLLFNDKNIAFSEAINYEMVADEIIRILAGSIGLVISIPVTTFLTAAFLSYFIASDKKIRYNNKI